MTQQLCPERTVLAAFSRGDLSGDIFEQIAAHVPDCPSCREVLAELGDSSDAVLAASRQVREGKAATPWPDTHPTHHGSPAAASAVPAPPGYELLSEVGRGGMGVVFRARDTRLSREVAIKLLRDDCRADSAVCTRFVAEAQITGQLQHPGIPAVHELGQLPEGRPFLAMKLVKGRTLQEMLHERGGPGQERGRFLAIFEQICQAVGYAHAHRVIHRDLKPSNVMVGAFGEVQVMDWGLAKLLAAQAPPAAEEGVLGETLPAVTAIETPQRADSATRTGSVMGTPAYMSPEQAGGEVRKLDARSDVFGLGAILCAILTGLPPYRGMDANVVRLQAVRGELADALSRLDGCGAEPEVVALCKRCLAFRQEDRPADGGAVAAAVASIRQAAEERARRAELERIEALVREAEQRKRRRVWLGLAACLLAGLFTSTGLGMWANYARQQAETAQEAEKAAREAEAKRAEGERQAKLEAVAANEQAQKRLKQIEKSNEILTSIFTDLDIHQIKQDKEPLEAVLAKRLLKAAEAIEGEAIGDQLAVAQLQNRLGMSLLNLGHPRAAVVLCEKARATRLNLLGADHPDTLTSMNNLAKGYEDAGQLAKALRLYEETVRLMRAKLGEDHPLTLTSMNNLAECYNAAGQLSKARPIYEQTMRLSKAKLGVDHPNTLRSINNLAGSYFRAGQPEKALPLYEESVRLMKAKLGADHPYILISMSNLAMCYRDAGQLDKALPLHEETMRRFKAKLGADHPYTLTSMFNLAKDYQLARQFDKALPLYEETLRLRKANLGAEHPETLKSMSNLATCYRDTGQFEKALPLLEEALRLQKAKLESDHPNTLITMHDLASAYQATGQLTKAVPLYEETLRFQKTKLGKDHHDTLITMHNLAACYQDAGQLAKALPLYEETLRRCQAKLGINHPDTLKSMGDLAFSYQSTGQLDKALPLLEETVRQMRTNLGADHPNTLTSMGNLADAYCDDKQTGKALQLFAEYIERLRKLKLDDARFAGLLATVAHKLLTCHQFKEAESYLCECLTIREKAQPDAWNTFNTQSMLGGALLGQKKYADAEPLLLKGYEGMKQRETKIPKESKARLTESVTQLVELYGAWGKPAEAAKWRKQLAQRKEMKSKSKR